MEPQYNYDPNTGLMKQKVYGKSKFKGCFIISIVLFIIVGGTAAYFIYQAVAGFDSKFNDITKKMTDLKDKDRYTGDRNADSRFIGDFIDAIIIPVPGSNPRVFILTDASKTYIETKKSPGYYSTGAACVDCKTMAYLFDPAANNIVKNTEDIYNDVVSVDGIALKNDKIFQFSRGYHNSEPKVEIYNSATGEMISSGNSFTQNYEELKSGLIQLNFSKEKQIAEFETKDGRKNIVYSIDKDKIYESQQELEKDDNNNISGEGYLYAMVNEKSDSRRTLYKVNAPLNFIKKNKSTLMDYAGHPNSLKSYNAESEKISEKVYIEGIIYFQDEEFVFIIHQDQAGKTANRIMTCIDAKTGSEKWTVNQDQLFGYMKIDENKNSSQSLSSTKDKIGVSRLGSLTILKLKGDGIMGFETESGKKLWSIQTTPQRL
jgi:hypothetical protein